MTLIAVYLGVADENAILDMSYDWFSDLIGVLGEAVSYAGIVNYAGNAFVEKSWDMIMEANPMLKGQIMTSQERSIADFFNRAEVSGFIRKDAVKDGGDNHAAGS